MNRRHLLSFMLRVPRSPAGLALCLVLLVLALFLIISVSALLLTGALVVGLLLAVAQIGRSLGNGLRDRAVDLTPAGHRRPQRVRHGERPLERYLGDVEEYDALTTRMLQVDLTKAGSWRQQRGLTQLTSRAASLSESIAAVERALADDPAAESARAGLWELVVATTELRRHCEALQRFPTTDGYAAQTDEAQRLGGRGAELGRRRDRLVRRLQQTDLRRALSLD